MTLDDKRNALRALSDRMCRTHHWRKGKSGPSHIDEFFDAVKLNEHLAGRGLGLCPIAPGESTCRVACLDLDSHKGETPWERMLADAMAINGALEAHGLRGHLFRSSGGNGIHIYLTWAEPQDAYSVRTFINEVLEENLFTNGTGGVAKGEVEIFPKQDEVPHDGFGNMFILPFTGRSEPLGPFHSWVDSTPVPVRERAESSAPRAESEVPPEFAVIKSALDAIPNAGTEELDYDQWRNIIFALHDATDGSDLGLGLAHEFSARSSKYDGDFLDNRVWPHIRDDRSGKTITARTLLAVAGSHGWQDPTTIDDFDIVEAEDVFADDTVGDAPHGDAAVQPASGIAFVVSHLFAQGRPPRWIVKGVVPEAAIGVVFGDSGSGKTFLALDLAMAIARGLQWRDKRVVQHRVAYICAEGVADFRNRINAYHHQHDLETTDLHIYGGSPSFLDAAKVKEIIKALKTLGNVGVVFVDTLAQVTAGGDENSGKDVGKVLAHCNAIHRATGALVILVHHSGKDESKGTRGWSGLPAACDFIIQVQRNDEHRVATVTKMKGGRDGEEFGFKLNTVVIGLDEDDDEITSCVVEHGAVVPGVKQKKERGSKYEREVRAVLVDLLGPGVERVSVEEVKVAFKARTVGPEAGKRDLRGQRVGEALERLAEAGRITIANDFVAWTSEE